MNRDRLPSQWRGVDSEGCNFGRIRNKGNGRRSGTAFFDLSSIATLIVHDGQATAPSGSSLLGAVDVLLVSRHTAWSYS